MRIRPGLCYPHRQFASPAAPRSCRRPTITALHPSGFAVAVEVASLDQVDPTITEILRRGYRPATGTGDGWTRTPDGLPLCPRHQVPMRPREKQGDTWYSHQVPDPRTGALLYCRGYASPSSPGWDVVAARG